MLDGKLLNRGNFRFSLLNNDYSSQHTTTTSKWQQYSTYKSYKVYLNYIKKSNVLGMSEKKISVTLSIRDFAWGQGGDAQHWRQTHPLAKSLYTTKIGTKNMTLVKRNLPQQKSEKIRQFLVKVASFFSFFEASQIVPKNGLSPKIPPKKAWCILTQAKKRGHIWGGPSLQATNTMITPYQRDLNRKPPKCFLGIKNFFFHF